MIRLAVFDFDGTLFDTSRGVFGGVNYALEALGLPRDEEPSRLRRMIGPPLEEGFPLVYGVDGKKATELYRVYYHAQGVHEYAPYPGMETLLRRLRAAGVKTAVATMKPEDFTCVILMETGWDALFDAVAGPVIGQPTPTKASLIEREMAALGVAREETLMIGDRTSDVEAGRAAGVKTVFCRFGFGAPGEAEQSGADAIADTVEALGRLLLGER